MYQRRRFHAGFSLVELVGVLAVIAILAAIIAPRVFETIHSAKITQTVAAVNAVKTATIDFTSRYSVLPVTDDQSRFDDVLVKAQLLDARFIAKVGNPSAATEGDKWTYNQSTGQWEKDNSGDNQNSLTRVVCRSSNTGDPATSAGRNFRLDGSTDLPSSTVIAAIIEDVPALDAWEISRRIDGEGFSGADENEKDSKGRVAYDSPSNGVTDVAVYILHR